MKLLLFGAAYFIGKLTLFLFLCSVCILIYRLYNHEDGTKFTFWGLNNVQESSVPFDNLNTVNAATDDTEDTENTTLVWKIAWLSEINVPLNFLSINLRFFSAGVEWKNITFI